MHAWRLHMLPLRHVTTDDCVVFRLLLVRITHMEERSIRLSACISTGTVRWCCHNWCETAGMPAFFLRDFRQSSLWAPSQGALQHHPGIKLAFSEWWGKCISRTTLASQTREFRINRCNLEWDKTKKSQWPKTGKRQMNCWARSEWPYSSLRSDGITANVCVCVCQMEELKGFLFSFLWSCCWNAACCTLIRCHTPLPGFQCIRLMYTLRFTYMPSPLSHFSPSLRCMPGVWHYSSSNQIHKQTLLDCGTRVNDGIYCAMDHTDYKQH